MKFQFAVRRHQSAKGQFVETHLAQVYNDDGDLVTTIELVSGDGQVNGNPCSGALRFNGENVEALVMGADGWITVAFTSTSTPGKTPPLSTADEGDDLTAAEKSLFDPSLFRGKA